MQRDQPELLPASDWVSFQSTDQPALQLLPWALFAGNCVRVGESLKVRCCWPGTGVFWGGQLWASGCAYLLPSLWACGCWYRGGGESWVPVTPSTSRGTRPWNPNLGPGASRLSLGWVMLGSCPALLGRSAGGFLLLDASPSSSEQLGLWASLGTVTRMLKSKESGVWALD